MNSKKIILILIFLVSVIMGILIVLGYMGVFSKNNSNIDENKSVRKILVNDITYEYDEGLSAYLIFAETGTERRKVDSEAELEYYKASPERLFDEYVYQEAQNDDTSNEVIEE